MRDRIQAVILIGIFCFLAGSAQASAVDPNPACALLLANSNSQRLQYLTESTKARDEWLRGYLRDNQHQLVQSSNTKPIERIIDESSYPATGMIIEAVRPRGSEAEYQLVRKSALGPTEVVKILGPTRTVLFSSADLSRNASSTLVSLHFSPDLNSVAVRIFENGSIDQSRIAIYDLVARRFHIRNLPAGAEPVWTSARTLSYTQNGLKTSQGAVSYDLRSHQSKTLPLTLRYYSSRTEPHWYASLENGKSFLVNNVTRVKIPIVGFPAALLAEQNGYVYFDIKNTDASSGIWRTKVDGSQTKPEEVLASAKRMLVGAGLIEGGFWAHTAWGTARTLTVKASDQTVIAQIPDPQCCSILSVEWGETKRTLNVKLSSAIRAEQKFIYDVSLKKFETAPEEINRLMMTNESDLRFQSHTIEVTSADGTKIPVRFTAKAESAQDGSHPVLIDVYGGFARRGSVDPLYDAMTLDFMARGGILLTPLVRGGNEFGEDWHTAGKVLNKAHSLDDVAATAKWAVTQRYSQPQKIILQGASHGGFLAAATAFQFPGLFGMVIPRVGVYDLLARSQLDASYDHGWDPEFGTITNEKDVENLLLLSPLEAAAEFPDNVPLQVILVGGRKDTRVNPIHTLKLLKILEEKQATSQLRVRLIDINNTGHFAHTPKFQNILGVKTRAAIWSAIYDYVGYSAI